jgi:hypothetical protein
MLLYLIFPSSGGIDECDVGVFPDVDDRESFEWVWVCEFSIIEWPDAYIDFEGCFFFHLNLILTVTEA